MMRHMARGETIKVSQKGSNDFVTQVDRAAEQVIVDQIIQAYPDHAILGEEYGRSGNSESDYEWIIDPLDGTTNFIHDNPQFAVSIAMRYRGTLEIGVIYDPLRQELFTAERGQGALLDGKRIRVTQARDLENGLVGTGFPYSDFEHLDAYMAMLKKVIKNTAGVRRPGSAALDLAWMAAGRLDAFWELNLKPWDIAAGALMIKEAGGMVADISGSSLDLERGHIVAGNARTLAALMKMIGPHVPAELR
jgi:myo-inositol-1(or 4)-monophosphatase